MDVQAIFDAIWIVALIVFLVIGAVLLTKKVYHGGSQSEGMFGVAPIAPSYEFVGSEALPGIFTQDPPMIY